MIKIGKIIGSFVRGAIKSFPLGNAIIEGVNNAKGGVLKTVTTEGGETVTGKVKDPHSWVSIVVQLLLCAAFVYGFYTKQIDLERLIEMLRGL